MEKPQAFIPPKETGWSEGTVIYRTRDSCGEKHYPLPLEVSEQLAERRKEGSNKAFIPYPSEVAVNALGKIIRITY